MHSLQVTSYLSDVAKTNGYGLNFSGGYLVTYLSLDAGLWALVLSIAVSSGFGMSLVYSNVVNTTMKVTYRNIENIFILAYFPLHIQWFPGKTGLMGSVTMAGFGYGSIIWNPLETAYVNPDNVSPVSVEGEEDK